MTIHINLKAVFSVLLMLAAFIFAVYVVNLYMQHVLTSLGIVAGAIIVLGLLATSGAQATGTGSRRSSDDPATTPHDFSNHDHDHHTH